MKQGLPHGQPIRDAHPLAPEIEDQTCVGHDPQPSQLNEKQDHRLTEGSESTGGNNGQPGHAGGRRGREQGVDPGDGAGIGPGCIQMQQKSAHQNRDGEEVDGKTERGEQALFHGQDSMGV